MVLRKIEMDLRIFFHKISGILSKTKKYSVIMHFIGLAWDLELSIF